MGYLKFKADRLFDGFRFLPPGKALITASNGTVEAIVDEADAGDDVQQFHGIVTPGFINCHCHLELSHLHQCIPENTGLVGFVLQVMRNRFQPLEVIETAIAAADQQLWDEGIVAVGDICNTNHTLAQKKSSRIHYTNFIEALGVQPELAEKRMQASVALLKEFQSAGPSFIVPHAPYSVSKALFEKIDQWPANSLLSIHNQEIPAENEWFRQKQGALTELYDALKIDIASFEPSGLSSLPTFLPWISRDHQLLLVHNVASSEEDIRFAKNYLPDSQLYWCLCPNANHYISQLDPPLPLLLQNNAHIVLGTDSLASNHALSIVAEINRLRTLHPAIALDTCLQWATSNGAKALQLDRVVGSFEVGKKPGIVLVNETGHHLSVTQHLL